MHEFVVEKPQVGDICSLEKSYASQICDGVLGSNVLG